VEEYKNCKTGSVIVIFGVTGDLTTRKLMPALYENAKSGRLPENLVIIGFARRPWNDRKMRDSLSEGIKEFARTKPVDENVIVKLLSNSIYLQSNFEDANGYAKLNETLKKVGLQNCLFYLATPPQSYTSIINNLGEEHMQTCEQGWRRIVVEKPFGSDLKSAKKLDMEIHKVFSEDQVYRMDHYLGKETVQNILAFRFGNGIFEPLWNRNHIDHVEITVAESDGIGTRAGYYEKAGVIKDVFQNHLLQLLTLTAMEAPSSFNARAVRDEKVKVLNSLCPLNPEQVAKNTYRGQYTSGLINGEHVMGYREEPGVAPDSRTETYMAAKVFVNNWRWAGVPFYLRSGKRLPMRMTQIVIQYTQLPLSLFGAKNLAGDAPNLLKFDIQPDEGITLLLGAKAPGPIHQIESVEMRFNYKETFGGEPPEAYERLLIDCLGGDATLFTRSDEVEEAWRFTEQILDGWNQEKGDTIKPYAAGTWGPKGSEAFMEKDGRVWFQ
jgi:glucose-6-phosphate 1-dehydrogenase